MNLKAVTITGADDSTSIIELVDLAHQFPFVEWGILVSQRLEGSPRFPGRDWIDRFSTVAFAKKLKVSTHVCGRWVRDMFVGKLNWPDLPECVHISQRIQINTHAEEHVSTMGLIDCLRSLSGKQFIFQWDGVNNHLSLGVHAHGLDVAALFDTSGGAGILPDKWPSSRNVPFWCGYAGGLGPQNVVNQVQKIEALFEEGFSRPYWIDMERRVRTEDDRALDMKAVRSVLESTSALLCDQQVVCND
jgi:hypothetical protein